MEASRLRNERMIPFFKTSEHGTVGNPVLAEGADFLTGVRSLNATINDDDLVPATSDA